MHIDALQKEAYGMDKTIRPAHSGSPSRKGREVLIALAMAVFFSLVFFTCNTPLGPAIGSDNAMYLTMGTAIAKGYAPYSEIFDHKGPLLFILQTLPQLFSGGYSTLSVFVQEVLFLWASLLVLARIARRTGATPVLVQLVYLAVLAPLLDGGNLTEEYANLFTLIGIDTMLTVFDKGDGFGTDKNARSLLLPAAAMGVMATLAFMTRANNMLPLCACVGGLALCLLVSKRFTSFGWCALGFVLGCIAAALPILLWLGHYGAIGDAIYGAITHNMMYADTGSISRIHKLLFDSYGHYAIFMAALSCLGAAAYFIRTRRIPLALAMVFGAAGGGLAGFISHKFYNHYLMLSVPLAAMGTAQILALLCERIQKKPLVHGVCAALCAVMLTATGISANALRESDYAAMLSLTPDAVALYDQVPEADRDRFLAYRVEPKWYVATEALPCMRFYFLQEILADADPAVMDEIVTSFETEPPLWVVLFYNRPFSPPYDARVQEILDTRYAFVDAKGQYQLLKYKEVE